MKSENESKSVLLLDNLHPSASTLLSEVGYHVSTHGPLRGEELKEALQHNDAVVVRSGTKIDKNALQDVNQLKIIGRAGVGIDNIDLKAARDAGVIVINAPGGNTNAVVEHTIGLMMALVRNILKADKGIHQGQWLKKECQGQEVKGKILGVFGAGRIGQQVIAIAQALGMTCIAYDPHLDPQIAHIKNFTLKSIEEILRQADIITLHMPSSKENHHMVNQNFLSSMKPGSYLINTARGDLVSENDLAQALNEGHLAGAALDVFEKEPLVDSPLIGCPRCILTPHLGASTHEAQEAVALDIAHQVIDFFQTGKVSFQVN